MSRILAIVWLSWKAALRYRLFWVLSILLLGLVAALPLLVKHDGTARGFTQIVLTYTLSTVVALLGFSTLWLACGTLARDIEDCQMQMVAVKPIARWEIWLGKWLGIMTLNAVLLALSGACIYGSLLWRSQKLTPLQKQFLWSEVLVSRASLREPPINLRGAVDKLLQKRLAESPVAPGEREFVRQQIEEQIKGQQQLVPPGYMRQWTIETGNIRQTLGEQPIFIRAKFFASQTNASGTFSGAWRIGKTDSPKQLQRVMSLAPETFHEFPVPASAIEEDGKLIINFLNQNNVTLLFPLEDGMEILYREGGFGLNFSRALGILFCWLSLLAAIGLAAASFLSFPVASFFAVALLIMVFGSGTLATSLEEGTVMGRNHETGQASNPLADMLLLPVFKVVISIVNLSQSFSPVDQLSNGRSITWGTLALAFAQVVLLLGGIFAAFGMVVFTRRELATAQGTS